MSSSVVTRTLLAAAVALNAGLALGQAYPAKPIRILTAGAGGGNDFNARAIAQGISGPLGQNVVVENRSTAESAGESTAKAAPDGYTLLYYGSNIWILPFLRDKVPFDPIRDFAPITLAVSLPNLIVVSPTLPVKSIKELIALAKAKPGELNYYSGTPGAASYFASEIFKGMAGVDMVNVAYKSGGVMLPDLLSGRIQLAFVPVATVAPLVKSGKLRAVGVTSSQPSALAPDVPTVAASGLAGYESVATQGMFAPAKTPAAVVNQLNKAIVAVLKEPATRDKLLSQGVEPIGTTPEQFGAFVKTDMSRLGKIIKEAGIREE